MMAAVIVLVLVVVNALAIYSINHPKDREHLDLMPKDGGMDPYDPAHPLGEPDEVYKGVEGPIPDDEKDG